MHPTTEQISGSVKLQEARRRARAASDSRRPIRPKSRLQIGAE
jgi:hypothetical protein